MQGIATYTSRRLSHQSSFSQIIITVGIVVGVIAIYVPLPSMMMTLLLLSCLVYALIVTDGETRGFALLCFVPHVLGTLFLVLNIKATAFFICCIFGLFFLRKYVKITYIDRPILVCWGLVLVFFIIAYTFGPRHGYSVSKLTYVVAYGSISIFFWKAFIASRKIDIVMLSQCCCIIALLHVAIAFDFCFYRHPTSVLDFDFFRDAFYSFTGGSDIAVSYHSVGVTAMRGVALLISTIRWKELRNPLIVTLICCLAIVLLIAQARQAIFGTIFILAFRILIDARIPKAKKVWLGFVAVVVCLFLVGLVQSEALQTSSQAATVSQSLNRDYDRAFVMISSHPILGAGLGGYSTDGEVDYPHNIILEMLCEMGLFGTFFVLCIVFAPFLANWNRLKTITASGFYALPLLLATFVRAMMSADLTENITMLTGFIVLANYHIKYAIKK